LLLPSTFAALPLFTPKAMTTTPIAEAPMNQFYNWTFGPDEMIDLFPICIGRMKADVFFSKLLLDSTCSKCAADSISERKSW